MIENLHSPPYQQPPESAGSSSAAADDLERLALEAEGGIGTGAVLDGSGAAQPQQPPKAPEVPTADFIAGMLGPAFDSLAPNWKVKQHEVRMLAMGWGAVLDHYFPGGVSSWGPWGVALASTIAVIGPRINVPPVLPPPKPDETKP